MRGKHRSEPLERLVREAQGLEAQGAQEINLVAQDLGHYGRDLGPGGPKLPDLLEALLAETSVPWYRLLYVYSAGLSERLVELVARSPRIVPYLDIPIQHAADRMLERMRRPERQRTLRDKLGWLRGAIPDLAIRTTCLVGFPGETDDDFRELLAFLEEAQFDRLGAFSYSPQDGTRATQYADDVSDAVKRDRLEELLEVQRAISAERLARVVGREGRVLVDRVADPDGAGATHVGRGARLTDVDGRTYLDYVCSWGPLILGHAHPAVLDAIRAAAAAGWSYGAPCEAEVELAEQVQRRMPTVEMVRFVNSGTEATMAAVRVARAATRRNVLLKFAGCYHGHADSFLVKAGSGVATLGLPDSPGVPAALAELTVTVPFNDAGAVEDLFRRRGDELAAVIVEPYVGNAGFIAPEAGFPHTLRALCDRHRAPPIFDEVMTGFPAAAGRGYRGRRAPPRGHSQHGTRGLDVGDVLHARPGQELRRGQGRGHGIVRALAPGRAGAWRVPRPLGVRGGIRLQRAYRCRHRLHHHTTRRRAGRSARWLAPSPSPGPVGGRNHRRSLPGQSRSCASGSLPARPASRWEAMASCSSPTTRMASPSDRSRPVRPGRP